MDKLPNETDKLLSDKYILAKDIRDLNRTLLDAATEISVLEDEVKNKVKLKDQLDQYCNAFDESMKDPDLLTSKNKASTDLSIIKELIEKLNTEPYFQKLQENIEDEKNDFIQVKQILIDNIHQLKDEINIIGERIKDRNDAISNATIERDNLKAQMKDIIEEIVGHKL
jgi:chromosome segregation ATPase